LGKDETGSTSSASVSLGHVGALRLCAGCCRVALAAAGRAGSCGRAQPVTLGAAPAATCLKAKELEGDAQYAAQV